MGFLSVAEVPLVEKKVSADAAIVGYGKAPEGHRGAATGPQADAYGEMAFLVGVVEFQVEVTGALDDTAVGVTQKIVLDAAVAGAEGVQAPGTFVAVQHQRHEALHGDRLARTVGPAENKTTGREDELCFIVQPEVHQSGPLYAPAFMHAIIPPRCILRSSGPEPGQEKRCLGLSTRPVPTRQGAAPALRPVLPRWPGDIARTSMLRIYP